MRASPEDKTYPEESNLSLLFFNDDTFFSEKCKIVNGEILANFSTTTKRIETEEEMRRNFARRIESQDVFPEMNCGKFEFFDYPCG